MFHAKGVPNSFFSNTLVLGRFFPTHEIITTAYAKTTSTVDSGEGRYVLGCRAHDSLQNMNPYQPQNRHRVSHEYRA